MESVNKHFRNQEGFTLTELLVVIIILGILVAFAFPIIQNQREKAWDKAIRSDIHNLVIEIESNTGNNKTIHTQESIDKAFEKFNNSPNVVIKIDNIQLTGIPLGKTFIISGYHLLIPNGKNGSSDLPIVYNSETGSFVN